MANLNKPTKFATKIIKGSGLTEQEHKDSCDINLMIKSINRGQNVRGGRDPIYGVDDTTKDGLSHRIQKDRVERELEKQFRETEFSEEEAEAIPPSVRKKYGNQIRIKKGEKNDKTQNNDKNAKNDPIKPPSNDEPNSNQPPTPKKPD